MTRSKKVSPLQAKFNVGDKVAFKLGKTNYNGTILKGYTHSFLISFKSTSPAVIDKYHNKVVISSKKLRVVKAAKSSKSKKTTKDNDNK
ncbi:hypothetical protein WR164_06170 [Philodulcilactobacillus myokoensis]|uniref:DUF2187 domain-containing protein n=1 Tax=Philodulcilactobacillus myokoensis TaxID=2929573 RepID=A0A9W6B0Z6_9LACO|nr:DUF2187 domain-containing protein [Philodulcilactobacillus myokoensis]GLB46638.1 hypothetical protein WR164_06170 [Philodulcilactobacillus myokoensis]